MCERERKRFERITDGREREARHRKKVRKRERDAREIK
jgi:hypothetical protein